MQQRLFIISNRLPVNAEQVEGSIQLQPSSGGLVSAINGFLNGISENNKNKFSEVVWVGVPGCSAGEWVQAKEGLKESAFKYMPVFINHNIYECYYNGLSNSVIWALFHYFPSYADYKVEYFESYIQANEAFLSAVVQQLKSTDIVWIHDYHLFPLAAMLRQHLPDLTIGFFLHIPFPSYEMLRLMPHKWQQAILNGILGADLIGFHTIDYVSHFLKSLQMVMGLEAEINVVKHDNRLIKVDVFPISIDYKKFNEVYNDKEVAALRDTYRNRFDEQKVLFSVDRLDYTKGIFARLKAYECFLGLYPEYREKITFIVVIVPSRSTIAKYAERKKEIEEFVGQLNGSIGTITWKPVVYQYMHLTFNELIALYTACHLAVIAPLRDGMNLVAKEFVASRQDKEGVLLLSETAGAARELTEALLVNPNDLIGFAEKIYEGLQMSRHEQARRIDVMQKRIRAYDVQAWGEDFFTQLQSIKDRQKEFEFMFLHRDAKMHLYEAYHAAGNRLLLLDYDGTLVSFDNEPQSAVPDEHLLRLLTLLAQNERNSIYLISGRDSATLENWFGDLHVNLIAEHGAKEKVAGREWKGNKASVADEHWQQLIYPVMEAYVKRCAHTFIEKKEYSCVWHYRNAEPNQAKMRATELYNELSELQRSINIQVTSGNKIIEVRTRGIDKGTIVKKLLKDKQYDFILACGDDSTDEDMFKVLAKMPEAFTIKIGDKASFAKYNLYTPQMLVSLLSYLEHPLP